MRNLGTSFNESNVITVTGGDDKELENSLRILYLALEVSCKTSLTPSEDRVVDGYLTWYRGINFDHPYETNTPAFAYVNLNTGVNLLFLIGVPHEGCRGGKLELDTALRCRSKLPAGKLY